MQQSMQISLLCSTEHKEENMIFINSPFAILDEAFRSLYPDKKYKACIEPSIKDDEGNRVFGFTQFSKGETPVIAISAELNIMDATEIFAHELAHVAAGEGAGHGERWDEEFQRIFDKYNRIGKERFGEDGKEIETAPEYRGGWIRSEDRMPEEGEDVLEVVFLTSAPKKDLPTHVTIRSTGRKSEALCEQPTPVSVERINNFVGKASEKEMEQIDIALLIGLGIRLEGAENQSGASRKSEQQIQSSVTDRSKEEAAKMAEENRMLREELKKQQESTIRSEAECSAYKAMHEQLLKKLMERRE